MPLGPMFCGRMGTKLDHSQFNERALKALGYVPTKGKRMTSRELRLMGFTEAAKALSQPVVRHNPFRVVDIPAPADISPLHRESAANA